MIELKDLIFKNGGHKTRDEGLCVNEAIAWLAGEPHSDAPKCVCPVLRRLIMQINDATWSSDAARTEALQPWVNRLMGTGATSTPEIRLRRAFALADVAVREITPERLDRLGYKDHADKLRALPKIVDSASAKNAADAAAYAADAAAAAAYAAAAAAYAAAAAAYAAAYAAYAAYAYSWDTTMLKWTNRLLTVALEIT